MLKEAIYHKIGCDYACFINRNELYIKLRTRKNDMQLVELILVDKYKYGKLKNPYKYHKMEKYSTDDLFDYYQVVISYDIDSIGYFFKLESSATTLCYGNDSFYKFSENINFNKMYVCPCPPQDDLFEIPDWAKRAIVYQIFPDRFYMGDLQSREAKPEDWNRRVNHRTLLGGNLQGIIDKLDYLTYLGINTLYLTPIFKAKGNHKYNTEDYMEIDENFGTKETFKELVEKAHQRDIKIILDGVFNHSGSEFFAFKDLQKKQRESDYGDWYHVNRYPVDMTIAGRYKSYAYIRSMPKLNLANKDTAEYFLKVAEYWVKEFNIDGWRFDVADEISHQFWREMRRRIKKIKPEALLVGEVWYEASPWLDGDQFDTVMNYPFFFEILDYAAFDGTTSESFKNRIVKNYSHYNPIVNNTLWNMVGSHDVPRIATHCNGDKKRIKLALLLQFTLPGVPMIYYGDEIAMTGGPDPDNRRGMRWDLVEKNIDIVDYYRKLIILRKEYESLVQGDLKFSISDKESGILSFKRTYKGEELVVYINNSSRENRIKIYSDKKSLISGKVYKDYIYLKPKTGDLLI